MQRTIKYQPAAPKRGRREIKRQKQAAAQQPVSYLSVLTERMERARAEKAERDQAKLEAALSHDALMSITYVPYVLVEVAWDYCDTIFDLAQMLRLEQTKKLKRAITELRRQYDRRRFQIIDSQWRQSELDNMARLQDDLGGFFAETLDIFRRAAAERYGEVEDTTAYLIASVYACRVVLQALFRFCEAHEKAIASILGYEINPLAPEETRRLYALIIEYAGDMRLPRECDEQVRERSDALARALADAQLGETKE